MKDLVVKWWQHFDSDDHTYGDYFLLPGVLHGDERTKRTYQVGNKRILYSPINWIGFDKDECKKEIDIINKDTISVMLDGQEVGKQCTRIQTDFFTLGEQKVISDGYWLLLDPLSTDTHTLNSYGSCKSGQIQIQVSYTLVNEENEQFIPPENDLG